MAKHRRETKAEDVHQLLDIFAKSPFRAKESDVVTESILQRCLDLFGRDYQFSVINNPSGELCGTYPTQLVLLEYEKPSGTPAGANCDGMESLYDMKQLKEILKQARRARCRARCVMPVILYEGKHICRSATLSSGAEIYGRSGFDFLFSTQDQQTGNPQPGPSHDPQNDWQLFDRVRGNDIQLLQALNVGYICDLMVEKKKVKFLMNITSSEKVDKEQRYSGFDIFCVPYPGCEFFRQWKDSGYETDQVLFDWSQGYVDASLDIPPIHLIETLGIDWKKYKQWDLLTLTRNYVKLLLHLLKEGHKGVLVHCISGWDRTPMFVSLLRLSLWADGLIHRSLSATEVLYLTVAYDWFLFGHNLTDRLQKGEEIMYFCFHFLKYITSEEFSLKPHSAANHRKSSKSSEVSDVEGPVGGVLIDVDHPTACTHRGSDSSLNSSGNTVPDSDLLSANQDQPLTNGSVCINTRSLNSQPELSAHYSPVGSSPMPVPNHLRHINDITVAQSPVSGSWQIISGMESYGCLSSSLGTSLDLDSIGGSFRSSRRSSHTSSCSEATEQEISVRWQRLNDVWRVFSNAYTNKISIRYGTASTGLGTLLDAFAGKVGIRNNPV